MTGAEKEVMKMAMAIWAEEAAKRNILPVLLIGICDDTRNPVLFGTENFPTQGHLVAFLEGLIDNIREID